MTVVLYACCIKSVVPWNIVNKKYNKHHGRSFFFNDSSIWDEERAEKTDFHWELNSGSVIGNPVKLAASGRTRTHDHQLSRWRSYQLSYRGSSVGWAWILYTNHRASQPDTQVNSTGTLHTLWTRMCICMQPHSIFSPEKSGLPLFQKANFWPDILLYLRLISNKLRHVTYRNFYHTWLRGLQCTQNSMLSLIPNFSLVHHKNLC